MKMISAKGFDRVWLFFGPLFLLFLGLDQLSKWAAERFLRLGESSDVGFALSHNTGIVLGFNLPLVAIYVLTAGILGLGGFLVVQNKLWQDRWHLFGLALLLAGAIGNLVDRLHYGFVVDFIKVYWWPTFNLADVWIVSAVILFAWEFLFREKVVEKL
ncbi:MAG: signal peptidase II [Candidatus Gracilibacteria bacterium]|jgi:signal peptidase II